MRKDNIFDFVVAESQKTVPFSGVTAQNVADALGIWRNDAAVELNKLVAEGKLSRLGKKNIRYFPFSGEISYAAPPGVTNSSAAGKETAEPCDTDSVGRYRAFDSLIGADGSLKYQLRVAMAAVSYPPYGLNMLITGPTGSGKSHLARTIWKYAEETRFLKGSKVETIPFVVFNCAEYADNPQLLLSHLFGYKKGAFTGAFEDKAGLVEEADGGILFLDEIHCLSSSGQESFFTLLDTGVYHRIGDSRSREAHFMLIGATTKPLTDLLETFLRRMPVVVSMPTLSERPITERVELVKYFYAEEASHIGRSLKIQKNALNSILDYSLQSNLGALKNMIQISCAKAFLRNSMSGRHFEEIEVDFSDLSFQTQHNFGEDDAYLGDEMRFNSDLLVSEKGVLTTTAMPSSFVDVYDFVGSKISGKTADSHDVGDIQQLIASEIDNYYLDLEQTLNDENTDRQMLDSVLFPRAVGICSEFLDRASHTLNRVYPPIAATLLAMHVSQYVSRMRSEQPAFPVDVRNSMKHCDKERQFILENREWLSQALKVPVSQDEVNCLAILLRQDDKKTDRPSVWITVVSDHTGVAGGMAKTMNNVFRSDNIHWVDSSTSTSLFKAVCDNIKIFHGTSGNIIFTDVKGLSTLESEIIKETGVNTRIVPILEQRLLMEAGRLTLNTEACDIDDLKNRVLSAYMARLAQFFTLSGLEIPHDSVEDTEKVILSLCVTGIGSAQSIKSILETKLSYIPNLTVIARSSLDNIEDAVSPDKLKLIVGTVNPHIKDVPFITADRVFSNEGILAIASLVDDWSLDNARSVYDSEDESGRETMSLLSESLQYIAPHVNEALAMACINDLIEKIETKLYHQTMPSDLRVRTFMHAASMLERLADGQALIMDPEHESLLSEKAAWFVNLQYLIQQAFAPFGMEIPRDEYFYFMLSIPENL